MSSESDSDADTVLGSDAVCVEVPTDDIRVGDSVLVLPGETFPIDVSVQNIWVVSWFRGSHDNRNPRSTALLPAFMYLACDYIFKQEQNNMFF